MTRIAVAVQNHDELIREVFIDPIRTVIVVDDEYPTLESLSAKELGLTGGWKGDSLDVERVCKLLSFARGKDKPWLIDVYDGKKNPEQKSAPYLHHSDLLVLDYHLEGNDGNGDSAIGILRKLAKNDHFNIVIVYTKGYEGDLDKVVREIALGLTYPDSALSISAEEKASLIIAFEKWEEREKEVISQLENEISEDVYLNARTQYKGKYEKILGMVECSKIIETWRTKPKEVNIGDKKQLVRWLMLKKQEQLTRQFSPENLGDVQVVNSGEVNWIRTDTLFITVVSKECSPDQLEAKLLKAIQMSFPSPHRLLLSKMRAEIDQRGVAAEAAILGNKHIQTEWLNDFLDPNPIDQRGIIHNTINRHWEALGDQLKSSLGAFVEKLHASFSSLDKKSVISGCGLNSADIDTDETLKYFNCFTSTKTVDRSHLTTGHIFRVDGETAQFWICLSPACDMVPDRKLPLTLTNCRPFIAVQLHKVSEKTALNDATKNIFIFLEIGENVETFSIHKDGNMTANPDWEQKFARNKGQFTGGNNFTVDSITEKNGELITNSVDVTVVAQLRSEYALNLLQRVGTFLSRPGLGMNFKQRPVKQ